MIGEGGRIGEDGEVVDDEVSIDEVDGLLIEHDD